MKVSKLDPDKFRERQVRKMEEFDTLPAEWRRLVHEYGWGVCKEYKTRGISAKDASSLIRHTLHELSPIYRFQHDSDVRERKKGDPLASRP